MNRVPTRPGWRAQKLSSPQFQMRESRPGFFDHKQQLIRLE
jgi:hypothetical protein